MLHELLGVWQQAVCIQVNMDLAKVFFTGCGKDFLHQPRTSGGLTTGYIDTIDEHIIILQAVYDIP
jgi:hypothetical protein